MSVIIIGTGGGGNHAIHKLVEASQHGLVTADQKAIAEHLIAQLVALAAQVPDA